MLLEGYSEWLESVIENIPYLEEELGECPFCLKEVYSDWCPSCDGGGSD